MEERKKKFKVATRCFTYNHAPYIEETLQGFTVQETTFPVVYCIVDDASTDATPSIIREFVCKNFDVANNEAYKEETQDFLFTFAPHKSKINCYFAVFYLKYNHHKIKKNKMQYIDEWQENSKYIAICEGDDYWVSKDKLQKQVEVMDRNPHFTLCHTGFDYYYEDRRQRCSGLSNIKQNISILQSGEDVRFNILHGNRYRIQTMTALFPSSIYKEVIKKRPEEWKIFKMGDTPLWILLLEKGDICFIPDVTAVYRIHRNSACRPLGEKEGLRFVLSSAEMRVLVGRYINLDAPKMCILNKSYVTSLRHYLYWVPNYQPIIMPQFDNCFNKMFFSVTTSVVVRPLMRFLFIQKKRVIKSLVYYKHKLIKNE